MSDDLLRAFLPRFKEVARKRVERSISLASERDHEQAVAIGRELHAVAGEAGLLGLSLIVPLARASEDHVKRLRASRTDADADALLSSLEELRRAIELVTLPERNS